MPLSKPFHFPQRSSFRCVAVMTACLFFASVSIAQENPFGQPVVTEQPAPVVDPFSTVPSSPSNPTTPAASPLSSAAPQSETPQPETSQPMVDAPSPFETAAPSIPEEEIQTLPPTTPPASMPQDVVDPFSTVSPEETGDQQPPVVREELNEEAPSDGAIPEESTLGLGARVSEEKESATADTDVIVKGTPPPKRPPIAAPPAESWMSIVFDLWPFLLGLLGLLLLWPLSKMFLGKKKNKYDVPVESNREIDPSKSSFKKSDRFSESAIDGDAAAGSDIISEVGEVSGLRLNESDILSESPEVPDQSDLNFDAFDSTTLQGDFKSSDDGLDDDDFAAMMLEDDGEQKTVGNAESDVSVGEMDGFTLDDSDVEPQMAENIVVDEEVSPTLAGDGSDEFSFDLEDDDTPEIASEAVAEETSNVADEFSLVDADEVPEVASAATIEDSDEFDFGLDDDDAPEIASEAVVEETSAVADEFQLEDVDGDAELASAATIEDSDEFDFGLDDDDAPEIASEAVVEETSAVADEFQLEDVDGDAELASAATIEDSDEFDFGLDDDDDTPSAPVATPDEDGSFELADVAGDAIADVGEELGVDLEPAEPSNVAAEVGLGAAAAAGAAAVVSMFGGGNKAEEVEDIGESAADFAEEKTQLNSKIAELESKLTAAQSDSANLESLQAKLDESELQRSEFESKLTSTQEEVKELKDQLDQSSSDKDAAEKLTGAEHRIEELESELAKSVEAAESSEKSLAELKSENDALKEEVADTQSTDALKEEIEAAKQESAKFEAELKESELAKEESISEADKLKSEIENLKSENEKLAQEVRLATESAESAGAEDEGFATGSLMSAAMGGVGGAAPGATASGDGVGSEEVEQEKKLRLETEAMLEEAEEHRTVVAVELRKVRKELKKLKKEGGAAAGDNPEAVEKLTQELADAKAEIAKLSEANSEATVATKKNEIEKLTADLEAQEKLATEAQQKISQLNDEIKEQRLAMVELEESSDRSELEAEITSLKQAVSESDLEAKSAAENAAKSKQEIASLKDEIENAKLSVREVTEAKDAAKSKLDVAESTLAEKDAEIEGLRRELSEKGTLSDVVSSQKTEIHGLTASLLSTKKGQEAVQQDLDKASQQLKEAQTRIEELNSASEETTQQFQKAERDLRSVTEEKISLEQLVARLRLEAEQLNSEHRSAISKVVDLERDTKHLKSRTEELEKQQTEKESAEAKVLIEKNELLSKQVGQLESAAKYSESVKEELKEIISVQKQRISDLEASVTSANEMATRQSETAVESNAALLKIEAALAAQTKRINAMEEVNLQSLAKIDQLQAAPAKRSSSARNSKAAAESGSRGKSSKDAGQLSEINGIGPTYQKKLLGLGVKTIKEISKWSNADVEKFAEKLGCGETVTRDWKEKAKELVRK